LPLAAAITGRLFTELGLFERGALFVIAILTLLPGGTGSIGRSFAWWNLVAIALFGLAVLYDRSRRASVLGSIGAPT